MTSANRFRLLLLCFFSSGMAALVYQSAWSQQLGLVFGTSEIAVVAVLAAYMGGLTTGSFLASRVADRCKTPVRTYLLLEVGIGLSALAVGTLLEVAGRLQLALLGTQDFPADGRALSSGTFYLLATFVVLALPTIMMGATLPYLVRATITSNENLGPRVGTLYSVNTVGGAVGTLGAAFLLLPNLGLDRTLWVAVALNALAALLATPLLRDSELSRTQPEHDLSNNPAHQRWILPVILCSGFVAFGWEILWTRLLSHVLGGSIYAFGTMLTTLLAGLAIGAAIASRYATSNPRATRIFTLVQLVIALTYSAAFLAANSLPGWIAQENPGMGKVLAIGAPIAALLMFPGAAAVGATFPLAVRILASGPGSASRASGSVYAWNTVGAIAGSIAVGWYLLPAFKIGGTATLLTCISLILAIVSSLLASPRRAWIVGISALGLITLSIQPLATPWNILRTSALNGTSVGGPIDFYEVGRSATVLLVEEPGQWRLTTNGLPESSIQVSGSRKSHFASARLLGLLPLVGKPDVRSMAIVGLGAGITVDASLSYIDEVDVVELEPTVLRANLTKSERRAHDPLQDPRVRVHLDDARSALRLVERRYDAIVSQPSHPWTAGAAHLFTKEFFEQVEARLNEDGVFVQWIGQNFIDEDLLRSLLGTLLQVFDQVEFYQLRPQGPVTFLAGNSPWSVQANISEAFDRAANEWRTIGVEHPRDLFVARQLGTEGARQLSRGAPTITDGRNLLQVRSPRVLEDPLTASKLDLVTAPFDPLATPSSEPGLYDVRRLIETQHPSRAWRISKKLATSVERRTAEGWLHRAEGHLGAARSSFIEAGGFESPGSEAFFGLMLLRHDSQPASGSAGLRDLPLQESPEAMLVAEAWRLAALESHARIEALDGQLESLGPRHPLAASSEALRIGWRLRNRSPDRAREAAHLLETQLALGSKLVPGLLQRSRLAILANDRDRAVASLEELTWHLRRKLQGPIVAGRALKVLESMPAEWRDDSLRKLEKTLHAFRDSNAQ